MIQHILCPTDFSAGAMHAVRAAIHVAQLSGAELTLLHVLSLFGGIAAVVRTQATAELERLVEHARKQGIVARPVLSEGNPVTEILKHCRAPAADLVVMGRHGRSGFDPWLLGSAVERVIGGAPGPVMVVGQPERAATEAAIDTIVCAESVEGDPAIRPYALGLARDLKAHRVVALHVLPTGRAATEIGNGPPLDPGGSVTLEARARHGRTHTQILAAAREENADLIVIGAYRPVHAATQLFGSTARRVVRQAPCPVITRPVGPGTLARPHLSSSGVVMV